MSRAATPARDVHQEVTDRLIAALEAGTRPWVRDWSVAGAGLPTRVTGEEYRGVNAFLLSLIGGACGFRSNTWMTFNQARALGGCVRKGEKSSPVIFYKQFAVGDDDDAGEQDGPRMARVIRFYSAFNVDQIDGLPDRFAPPPMATVNPDVRDTRAEEALRSCGADIREGGNGAFYNRVTDHVQLPAFDAFHNAGGFLATMAHELVHWTSAPHRLDRDLGKKMGDSAYAFEELIAEIGATFLCARLHVAGEHFDNHAAYLGHWLKVLRGDKKAIFRAAAQAQLAADMVLAKAGAGPAEPVAVAAPIAAKAAPAQAELVFA